MPIRHCGRGQQNARHIAQLYVLVDPDRDDKGIDRPRAGLIIRRIQDFVKKREPHFAPVDLAETATEAMGLMAAEARERRIQLHQHQPGGPVPPVLADRILLEQVLVNLIRNGMEATAEGPATGTRLTMSLRQSGDGVILR